MPKTIFAVLVAAWLAISPASAASAQTNHIAVDGCANLARIIYTEVAAAAIYGPGKSGPWKIDLGKDDISLCDHTAKTVSRAFTSALLSAGIDVNWRRSDGDSSDFCMHAFLSQCYPERYPHSIISEASAHTWLQNTWLIVSQAVMRDMYNPISSDVVSFRYNDLKLRLGLSLRSVVVFNDH
jgi:hypothetical protein